MNDKPAVLVVDDDESFRSLVSDRLTRTGHRIAAAAGGEAALTLLDGVEVAIVDLLMPGMDGLTLLKKIRQSNPDIAVIMLTGHGTIDNAVEAMKVGAADYLQKPCSLAEVELRIGQVWEKSRLRRENVQLRAALQQSNPYHGIVGKSPGMQAVIELIRKVKDSATPVLIEGESGTGKELVAAAIHRQSGRAKGPFVPVNCSAIPADLMESEFFGHVRGAFSGAVADALGLFRSAHGGTLFLDEIAELSPALQAKLLRVLQEGVIERLGSNKPITVDVRVVSSTHRDLPARIRESAFREDLYYRLNVFNIRLPPLRERREDVANLAVYFLRGFARELAREAPVLTSEALRLLERHAWPGNVRELQNLMERVAVLAAGPEVDVGFFTTLMSPESERPAEVGPEDFALQPAVEQLERKLILRALAAADDNKAEAARVLGISERTLWYKLKRYGL